MTEHKMHASKLGAVLVILTATSFCINIPFSHESKPQVTHNAEIPAGNGQSGKKLFANVGCYACHGREAQGEGAYGPRLAPDPIPYSAFIAYVRKPADEMPRYGEQVLSDAQLTDIYAFLESQPHPQSPDTIPILR
jgi:mono/diheme cytochrome c family protein